MCNRFYNEMTIDQIEELLGDQVDVLEEARRRPHKDDQRPSDEVLILVRREDRLVLGTGFWGFPKPPSMGKGLIINARSERLDSSPMWRDCSRCWLPATGWIEYIVEAKKNVPQFIASPDGSPMLLAGISGSRDGSRRVAMCMQDAPPRLAYLCDRLPLAYAFDAIGASQPEQIMDQVIVTAADR